MYLKNEELLMYVQMLTGKTTNSFEQEEYLFFRLSDELESFYSELFGFAERFDIEREIFDELIGYQKNIIRQPSDCKVTIRNKYDFYGYFNRIYSDCYAPLEKKETVIDAEFEKFRNRDEYARVCIWYGRRDDAQLRVTKKNGIKR